MLDLIHHFLQISLREVLTFTFENFMQALFCDEAMFVLKVVESELQVLLCECVPSVHDDRKEIGVVNHSLVLQISLMEDGLNVNLAHIRLGKSFTHVCHTQHSRVVHIEQSEFLAECFDIKSRVFDKESQCFELKAFVHMEVLKSLEHSLVYGLIDVGLS